MVTCAVFLRLNSLLKLAVLLLAVAVYAYLIHLAFLALTRVDMLHRSVRPLEQNFIHWIPLSDKCANKLPGVAQTTNHNMFKTKPCILHTLTAFKGCPLTCPSPLSPC